MIPQGTCETLGDVSTTVRVVEEQEIYGVGLRAHLPELNVNRSTLNEIIPHSASLASESIYRCKFDSFDIVS